MQCAGIDARVSRTLYIACLQSAVLEHALAVAARHDLAATVRVELGMLTISQIHLELLFGAGIEAKVRLIGKVVRVKDHSYKAGLANEGLRLFGLAAVNARVLAIAHLGLCIAVYDLKHRAAENAR